MVAKEKVHPKKVAEEEQLKVIVLGAATHKTGDNGSNQKWVLKMGVPSGKQDL